MQQMQKSLFEFPVKYTEIMFFEKNIGYGLHL